MAHIWQLSIIVFDDISLVSGVILKGSARISEWTGKSNFHKVLSSYFRRPLSNESISILTADQKYQIITDEKGGFALEIKGRINQELKLFLEKDQSFLETVQEYPTYFGSTSGRLQIISDLDDSIIVSHTANLWKRIYTLFLPVDRRKPVVYTRGILAGLNSLDFRIFYVSKSESNLFGLLSTFITRNEFPRGHLILTPYLRFFQLLYPKKGKAFKSNKIEKIIDLSGDRRFVLIGDDTQKDIQVYSDIALKYGKKVLKIYIRKTRKKLSKRKMAIINKLQNTSVPIVYFADMDDFKKEIGYLDKTVNSD